MQAHFLREHFPDVDITAELIRDEIVTDATISHKLEAFDPYMGNLLESICCRVGQSKQAAFLAFPMGDLNGDLSGCLSFSWPYTDIYVDPRPLAVCL